MNPVKFHSLRHFYSVFIHLFIFIFIHSLKKIKNRKNEYQPVFVFFSPDRRQTRPKLVGGIFKTFAMTTIPFIKTAKFY